MKSFPEPLSTKEEYEELGKMKKGDVKAREVLIERNLRLVAHIVKKYNVKENTLEDMLSIGIIGLIKAIDSFDMTKNYKLGTYASRCIENEILMEFRNDKKLSREVYMYETVKTDNSGNQLSVIDVLESVNKDVVENMYTLECVKNMYKYINEVLSYREKEILTYRYGLYGKDAVTQRELAAKLGISRSYVSRIEKAAINKIAKMFLENSIDYQSGC